MRGKKLLILLLSMAIGSSLSIGFAACDISGIFGGGTSNGSVSSIVPNSSNTKNDGSSSTTNTGNEGDNAISSSLESSSESSSSEADGSLESSSEIGRETDSASDNSSKDSSDDMQNNNTFDASDYDANCLVGTISEDGKSASVTDFIGSPTKAKIPSTYQNVPVTAIAAGAFDGCRSLLSLVIGENVAMIGLNVFLDCTSLTSGIVIRSFDY